MSRRAFRGLAACLAVGALAAASCGRRAGREVVVFCALDQVFSEPVLDEFERRTGIRVLAKFDTEATKTVGLANALLEQHRTGTVGCDVFWNNEILQTVRLKAAGALARYESPAAGEIPDTFKDPEGCWTGFAARARVIIYNRNLVSEEEKPKSLSDMVDPKWKGKATIARPLAGTTATHAAALFALWGDERAKTFFESMLRNEVFVALGNATVRDMVVAGERHIGLTDTDDVAVAILRGDPVGMVFPDQGADADGTLVIPNTVAVIAGCPHPDEARELVDFILSPEVEERLAAGPSAQIPLRPGVPSGGVVPPLGEIRATAVDYRKVADRAEGTAEYLRKNFRH